MIELQVLQEDQQPVHYEFQQDEVTIGRRSGNDLVLPEASISSKHARIYVGSGAVRVEDLGSTNGTELNGEVIAGVCEVTQDDDVVIGSFRLKLVRAVEQASWEQMFASLPASEAVSPRPGEVTLREEDEARTTVFQPRAPEGETGSPAKAAERPLRGEGPDRAGASSGKRGGEQFRPPVPKDIEATGLKRGHIIDLVLKTVYFSGEISGYELADEICLPFKPVIEPIVLELRRDKMLDVRGGGSSFGAISMVYSVTAKAMDLIRQILDRNRYTGPAPVTIDDYVNLVEAQSIRGRKITKQRLAREFGHLILGDEVFDGIGPAMNSGMAILFYGPPGNGKSAICQAMIHCFDDNVFVPYAIEVDGNIIKVFDEHNHKAIPTERNEEGKLEFDPRYVLCRRPLIMVGGELTLEMLDMSYSPDARFYEAPIQLKANGGILLVDDFGRQKASPRELLNRWIVPLESEFDFISLVTGKKLRIPFDVFVVFATNLEPESLVDDAFLRRVRYKLEIGRPGHERYRQIFEMVCSAEEIYFREEGFDYLTELYARDQRPMNACDPRNLLEAVRSLSDYFECEPELSHDLIDRAYRAYFTRVGEKK